MNSFFVKRVLVVWMASLAITAWGQPALFFNHLSVKEGLSQNIVYCIHQDQEGFMWFATAGGLTRFDGSSFKVYQPNPDDPWRSLRHSIIWDIVETTTGELWVATLGAGVHHIDKRTGVATAYSNPNPGGNLVYQICIDQAGILWSASEGGLNRFDPKTKEFALWASPNRTSPTAWSVLEDSQGTLWVGTATDLYQVDRKTRRWTRLILDARKPEEKHHIISLYEDAQHRLWVASLGKGLFHIEKKAGTNSYWALPSVYLPGLEIFPNAIQDASPEALYVGTHGEGLKRVDKQTGNYITYKANPKELGSISNNSVWSINSDRMGNLWVGTDYGINLNAKSAQKFQIYQRESDPTFARLPANNTTTLLEDRLGRIWLSNFWGLYADGLYSFDRRTNRYTHYKSRPGDAGSLLDKQVTAVYEDHTGTIWVGTAGGIQALDTKTNRFTQYPATIKVMSIQEDLAGDIWLGGAGGIARWNRKTGTLTYISQKPTDRINQLLVSSYGNLWVAFSGLGLGQIDVSTGVFTSLSKNYGYPGQLNDPHILCLYEDPSGILWAGTNYGGVNRYDPVKKTFTAITMRQGLPSNHIVGILRDERGSLWLATGKGLCQYDPRTSRYRNFDQRDGLPDNEFYSAYARSQQGNLLFGGPNGFTIFKPDSLSMNTLAPPVYITALRVGKRIWPFVRNIVKLPHDENFIELDFVGLNYVNAARNQYAYTLDGLDKGWNYCGGRRFAHYTDLTPGQYTFRVKAANNDGVWTTKAASITIIIDPPWWRTWWAYSFYTLLIGGSFWVVIRQYARVLKRKNRILEQKVALRTQEVQQQKEEIKNQLDYLAETLQELKVTQIQLIQKEKLASLGELTAGIAHEIQNPLNFVNNFAEVSTEVIDELAEGPIQHLVLPERELAQELLDELTQNLRKISHHGGRAAGIVRAMLAHSRTSTGERRLTDLNNLIQEYLTIAYQGYRATHPQFHCQLVTEFDNALVPVSVMPQELGRVLLNLFNNAFYAVAQQQNNVGNDYQPLVRVQSRQLANGVQVRVEDNGSGIAEEVKAKIFQPFFTTKPTGQGTGLGLSLSYDIITKGHGGELYVDGQPDQSTVFTIFIPTPISSPSVVSAPRPETAL